MVVGVKVDSDSYVIIVKIGVFVVNVLVDD